MATFDEALAGLDTKIDALIARVGDLGEAEATAVAAANEAKAQADAVIADDAASDEAQDQARADALGAVGSKIDAVLAGPAPETPEEPAPADPEVPVETPVDPEAPVE